MSIYADVSPFEIERCLKSLIDQELTSDQIVLVRDGPIKESVEQCIGDYASQLPFEHVFLTQNRGLGHALRIGLESCKFEIVARVDADDISLPKRFFLQTRFLAQNPTLSVLGGWMSESHQHNGSQNTVIRKPPIEPKAIIRYARRRNPLNHPTVMFRKSSVLSCGGYQPCLMFEDYFLWARMLMNGYKLANMPQTLVTTQVDRNYFSRRGGVAYLRHEIRLLRKLYNIGFLSLDQATIFLLIRLPVRLLPLSIRTIFYQGILRAN